MNNEQSSRRDKSFAEMIAQFVTQLPKGLAGRLLSLLGREQPDIFAYYPELDKKIRELLQQELGKDGYSHVQVKSVDKGENSSDTYPYVYQLLPDTDDPTWGQKYLPNVQKALHRRLASNTELDFRLGIGTAFIKLRLHNHMHVARERNAAFMQD